MRLRLRSRSKTITTTEWVEEKKEDICERDIYREEALDYAVRHEAYCTGFENVRGLCEDRIHYVYDAVRIYLYKNKEGLVVNRVFTPFFDGEEVSDVEVKSSIKQLCLTE